MSDVDPATSPPVDPKRRKGMRIFSLGNRVVRPLLASRLHWLLSRRLMLLSWTGKKTGRQYTIPIGYFRWDEGEVLAFSRGTKWPHRIRDSQVELLIAGRANSAEPTIYQDREAVADLLAEFARRNGPKAAKGLLLGLPGDRQPTRDELRGAAMKTRIIRFRLLA